MAEAVAWQYRRFDVYWKGEKASWGPWWNCTEFEARQHSAEPHTEVRALGVITAGVITSAEPSKENDRG